MNKLIATTLILASFAAESNEVKISNAQAAAMTRGAIIFCNDIPYASLLSERIKSIYVDSIGRDEIKKAYLFGVKQGRSGKVDCKKLHELAVNLIAMSEEG